MVKSADAFRTISEVAEWLGVQAHVLRFWESKFSQVKPIKRAGGRRYYRPADMLLLGGIKQLLHEDGLTIKGAQKLLREKGTAFVSDLSQPLDDLTVAVIEGSAEDLPESDALLSLDTTDEADAHLDPSKADPAAEDEPEPTEEEHNEPADVASVDSATPDPEPETEETDTALPAFRARPRPTEDLHAPAAEDIDAPEETSAAAPREKFQVTPPAPKDKAAIKPRVIDVGPLPELSDFPDQPTTLSSIQHIKSISADDAAAIRPLVARLTRLRASMASPRKDIGKD